MKTVLVFMLVGALVGVVVASFVVPPMLAWYNAPGAIQPGQKVETLCNLPDLIRYATKRLLLGQLIGAVAGAIVFIFPGLAVRRRREPGLPAEVGR